MRLLFFFLVTYLVYVRYKFISQSPSPLTCAVSSLQVILTCKIVELRIGLLLFCGLYYLPQRLKRKDGPKYCSCLGWHLLPLSTCFVYTSCPSELLF